MPIQQIGDLPMKLAALIKKISDIIDKGAIFVAVILLAAMTVVTFLQIIFRVFFSALVWSEEASRYLMIWLTFIGASCVHKRAGHIAITFIQDLLPEKPKKLLQLLVHLLTLFAFGVVVHFGITYINLVGNQLSAAMRIPMRYMYIAMPLGAGLMMLHTIDHLANLFLPTDQTKERGLPH